MKDVHIATIKNKKEREPVYEKAHEIFQSFDRGSRKLVAVRCGMYDESEPGDQAERPEDESGSSESEPSEQAKRSEDESGSPQSG
jgi:hypothetical protein